MSIQREYPGGPFVAQCNTCLDTEELEGDDSREALSEAKRRGYAAHFYGRRLECSYCSKAAELAAQEAAFRQAENRYELYIQGLPA